MDMRLKKEATALCCASGLMPMTAMPTGVKPVLGSAVGICSKAAARNGIVQPDTLEGKVKPTIVSRG
jgi:hypothetical protein